MRKRITENQFKEISSGIIGLPVSHVWRGYGSAIFLEFGDLEYSKRLNNPRGEFSLCVEWSWRIENKRSIWFGSFSGNQRMSNQLPKLKNKTVNGHFSITVEIPYIIMS